MNIRSLGDLLRTTEPELLGYKNFGETSLNEIKALLASKGLRLGQAADESQGRPRRPRLPAGNVAPEVLGKIGRRPGIVRPQPQGAATAEYQHARRTCRRTEDELLGCKNFGQTSLNEIKQQLRRLE